MSRPGNNPKRRVIDLSDATESIKAQLEAKVRYVGSGHHKRDPRPYKLPSANPRPNKSLCDNARTTGNWGITVDWANLESGSLEERAGFAALCIRARDTCLTEGHDRLSQTVREAPYLSAYHLAEWLAWNWWRLRWEPAPATKWIDWEQSHCMASIGAGYIWPNIRIASDGQGITLECQSTPERDSTPFRYINTTTLVIPAVDFESGVDVFVAEVLERLNQCQVAHSNLDDIWDSVCRERADPELFRRRKLEAMLGGDPGEMAEGVLDHWLDQSGVIGWEALGEIAVSRRPGKLPVDIDRLVDLVRTSGSAIAEGGSTDVSFDAVSPEERRAIAPWELGERAARSLRQKLGREIHERISSALLAELFGAPEQLLKDAGGITPKPPMTLEFAEPDQPVKLLLRSPLPQSRRFEMARLLGDRLLCTTKEPLRPATRAVTYRQKVQRAFAAELLSPFVAVKDMLDGDYSEDQLKFVAEQFQVSERVIQTQLVNHGYLSRDVLLPG